MNADSGKDVSDPRVLTDCGDLAVQEIRDCGVDDRRLMNVVSESVKIVMEAVGLVILACMCTLVFVNVLWNLLGTSWCLLSHWTFFHSASNLFWFPTCFLAGTSFAMFYDSTRPSDVHAFSGSSAPINFRWRPLNFLSCCKSYLWEAWWPCGHTSSGCTSWYLWSLWRKHIFPCIIFCPNYGGWLCSETFAGKL